MSRRKSLKCSHNVVLDVITSYIITTSTCPCVIVATLSTIYDVISIVSLLVQDKMPPKVCDAIVTPQQTSFLEECH